MSDQKTGGSKTLDIGAAVVTLALAGSVLFNFVIGKHYIIPTVIMVPTLLMANITWFGLKGELWAKYILCNMATLIAAHAFFGLFWAKTPREMLGDGFYPAYGALFLLMAGLAWTYARANGLYRRG